MSMGKSASNVPRRCTGLCVTSTPVGTLSPRPVGALCKRAVSPWPLSKRAVSPWPLSKRAASPWPVGALSKRAASPWPVGALSKRAISTVTLGPRRVGWNISVSKLSTVT